MAITDDPAARSETRIGHAHYCPQCGHVTGEGHFCVECGHPLDAAAQDEPTAVIPPAPPPPAGPPPAAGAPRSRVALIVVGGALGLAAIAAAAVIVLTGSKTSTSNSYSQKLTVALAPVLSANTALSNSLTSLRGNDTTAAKNAAGQAQSAVTAARGAVAVLTVPSASAQLSQQVQQALAQEAGYLQAVSTTLSHPSAENISPLPTLATNTQSAFVPLGSVAPGAGQSLSGTGALISWASGRIAIKPKPNPGGTTTVGGASTTTTTTTATATALPPAVSTGTDCGNGLHAGANTSCAFAQNVRAAWEAAPGTTNTIQVYSPVTGRTYTMNCAPAGSGITCSGANNASVSW